MTLPPNLKKQLDELLTPFMVDTQNRHTLLDGALYGHNALTYIKWDGTARSFTSKLTSDLILRGEYAAIIAILEHLKQEISPSQHAKIDQLILAIQDSTSRA